MKITILVNHLDSNTIFLSDEMEYTLEEYNEIRNMFEKIKEINYLKFPIKNKKIYIPNNILQESVVTIAKH